MEALAGWTIYAFSLFAAIIIAKTMFNAFRPDLAEIPGPFLSRFTTWPLKISVLTGHRTAYIHQLHQKYGAYVRIGPREIAIADLNAAQQIHKVGTRFRKSEWYQNQTTTQVTDDTCGVFGIRGLAEARRRRKYFQQAGTKAIVMEWEPMIISTIDVTVSKIKRDASQGEEDIMKWWTMMTADILGSLAFGEPFRMIEYEQKSQLIKDIEDAMIAVGIKLELPLLYWLLNWTPIPAVRRLMRVADRLRDAGYKAVENTKRASQEGFKTLFSKMYPEDGTQPFSDDLMADEASNIIIAGTDTTAMTLTYLVYEVLQNPGIKTKLLKELEPCSADPRLGELEEKQYLNNVIQETLRLHSAVPASLPRTVPAEGAVFGGYHIPAGYTVSTQAYTLHRNPHVWADPEK